MSVKTEIDFSAIYEMCSDGQKGGMWQYVSQMMKTYVKLLMTRGIDINGRAYKPYSASYTKLRKKEGLGTKVTLEFSSKMKLSIVARNTRESFEVFITGADNNRKAEWVSKEREFLAWGKKTEEKLSRDITRYFQLKGWS